MKIFVISMTLLWSVHSVAQVLKVDLNKEPSSMGVVAKRSPLSQLKDYENHLKWSDCVKLAPTVFASQKELRGWVGLTWLHCLEQAQKKKSDLGAVEKPLLKVSAQQDLFTGGPWSSDLSQIWLRLRMAQLEDQVQKKNRKAGTSLENLLLGSFELSREQKAKAYQLLGDLALQKVKYSEALFLYEEAQAQKDSKYLQEKIDFLLKIKGESTEVVAVPPSELGGDEMKIEERLRQSLRQNDAIPALKDLMILLNQFPGSQAARRLKDKPLDIYISLSEPVTKVKALNEIVEADSVRLLEWAQSLHRRGDYFASLMLAQRAAAKSPQSPQVTSALWIGGRSAHFLGQYDVALEKFATLISSHSGSDEAAEALFRSGLIHYRKKNFSNAAALLERLLSQGKERYSLVARYWLVRSLQETNGDRAKQVATELIEKYPFSYYGLRLLAESQQGKLTWPEIKGNAPKLNTELYLVGSQKKSWERFKVLSNAGWVNEAQAELADMPFIKDPTLKISLAQKIAERGQYATAIRLINEAMEKDVRLRREQFVKIGYPEVFESLYQEEATRYGIHPSLLRSLTRQESAFNLQAVSSSNALGLMQMIPPTAQEIAKKLGLKVELPDDMFRAEVNIPMGTFYISQMLDQFEGNVPFALAAYNAGPHRLKQWITARAEMGEQVTQASSAPQSEIWFDELPWSETSFYVKAILRNILLYRLVSEKSFTLKPVLWQDLHNKKSK